MSSLAHFSCFVENGNTDSISWNRGSKVAPNYKITDLLLLDETLRWSLRRLERWLNTTQCNSRPRGSYPAFWATQPPGMYMVSRNACRQSTHVKFERETWLNLRQVPVVFNLFFHLSMVSLCAGKVRLSKGKERQVSLKGLSVTKGPVVEQLSTTP